MNTINDRTSLLYTATTRVIIVVAAIAAALYILRGGTPAAALFPAGLEVVFLLADRVVWAFSPEPDPMGMLDDVKEKAPGEEFYIGGE